jgi:hypothetical protein
MLLAVVLAVYTSVACTRHSLSTQHTNKRYYTSVHRCMRTPHTHRHHGHQWHQGGVASLPALPAGGGTHHHRHCKETPVVSAGATGTAAAATQLPAVHAASSSDHLPPVPPQQGSKQWRSMLLARDLPSRKQFTNPSTATTQNAHASVPLNSKVWLHMCMLLRRVGCWPVKTAAEPTATCCSRRLPSQTPKNAAHAAAVAQPVHSPHGAWCLFARAAAAPLLAQTRRHQQ